MKTTQFKKENEHRKRKQNGFTLVEILGVIAVIAVLSLIVFNKLSSVKAKSSHSQITEELTLFFPTAVNNCIARIQANLNTCNTAKITTVSISPLTSTRTPCNDNWSAVASTATVVITYPLDSCVDADSLGADLAIQLSSLHKIAATYSATNDDLSVTYSR